MENYQSEYKNFIKDYLNKYSPFKLNEMVIVKVYNTNRPYEVTEIKIDESTGDFKYYLQSPRSFASIPTPFKMTDLEKFIENL